MEHKEANKLLSEYVDDRLTPETTLELEKHISNCEECSDLVYSMRKLKEDVKNLTLKIKPKRNLWKEIFPVIHEKKIKSSGELNSELKIRNVGEGRSSSQKPKQKNESSGTEVKKKISSKPPINFKKISIYVLILITVLVAFYYFFLNNQGWEVTVQQGNIKINGNNVSAASTFNSSDIILTNASSRAKITIQNGAEIIVNENTKLQKLDNKLALKLLKGSIKVKERNYEKLLNVQADNSTIISYNSGTEYNIYIDEYGSGFLEMLNSWASIESSNKTYLIPPEFKSKIEPAFATIPYKKEASENYVNALISNAKGESTGENIDLILDESDKKDAITLYYLLLNLPLENRVKVFDKLYDLVPPPPQIEKGGVVNLNMGMLEIWLDKIKKLY